MAGWSYWLATRVGRRVGRTGWSLHSFLNGPCSPLPSLPSLSLLSPSPALLASASPIPVRITSPSTPRQPAQIPLSSLLSLCTTYYQLFSPLFLPSSRTGTPSSFLARRRMGLSVRILLVEERERGVEEGRGEQSRGGGARGRDGAARDKKVSQARAGKGSDSRVQ